MLYPVLQDPLRPVVGSLFDRPVGVNIRQMLFGVGEQGLWYDVADMSTLFQDSAGTTPVTAVEQPVGRILDKSGRGNHATQATTTKRPVYSRRVNLLLATTTLSTQSITTRSAAYTLSFSGAGSITLSGSATGGYSAGTHAITCTAGSLTLTVTGVVADARCVLAIDAHLPYQRVNTATDYDADPSKFPAYLRYDGIDDSYQSIGNIDFTGTDKVTVWAGITKLSDAADGCVAYLGTGSAQLGIFNMFAPGSSTAAKYLAVSKGSAPSVPFTTSATYAAPHSGVIAFDADIAADVARLFVNGVQIDSKSTDQGTGTYGNHPLNVGAQNGTLNFFNGRNYGLIIRGAQSSAAQLAVVNDYLKQQMRLP